MGLFGAAGCRCKLLPLAPCSFPTAATEASHLPELVIRGDHSPVIAMKETTFQALLSLQVLAVPATAPGSGIPARSQYRQLPLRTLCQPSGSGGFLLLWVLFSEGSIPLRGPAAVRSWGARQLDSLLNLSASPPPVFSFPAFWCGLHIAGIQWMNHCCQD